VGNSGLLTLGIGPQTNPNSRCCIRPAKPEGPIPEAFFSLLDHAILNPENAVCDARANPLGSTLDFFDFGFGRCGDLVYLGVVVA